MTQTSLQDIAIAQYHELLGTFAEAAETLPDILNAATELIFTSLLNDGKLLTFGEGRHALNASQFYLQLNANDQQPTLPIIYLDHHLTNAMMPTSATPDAYANHINALGTKGDILVAFYGLNNHPCMIKALAAAHNQHIEVIAIGPSINTHIHTHLHSGDIAIAVPGLGVNTILQQQLAVALLLSQLINIQLFGSNHYHV